MTFKSETWYCKNCPLIKDDCGPWNDKHELFKIIRSVHKHHIGFQKGQPLGKKLNIEIEFGNLFDSIIDKLLHQLISTEKGMTKSCLISHKPWREIENWEL